MSVFARADAYNISCFSTKEQRMTLQTDLKNNKAVAKAQALARLDVDDLLKRPLEQRRQGFQPGRSGNPGGRPRGVLNNRVNPLRKLLLREGLPVLRKVVEMAKNGDMTAARIVVDRLLPRERLITLALPKIIDAPSALLALAQLLDHAAKGELTTTEANNLSSLAKNYLEIDAVAQLKEQVAALEAKVNGQ
jgi:hypothetical protein